MSELMIKLSEKREMLMKARDYKLAILYQLSQEAEPISLLELMDKLEFDCTTRTVSRWIHELVNEGLIQKSGHTKGTKYANKVLVQKEQSSLVLDQDSPNLNQMMSCFSTDSQRVIAQITKPLFERQPITYNMDWVNSYQPNRSYYLPVTLREKLQKAGKRAHQLDPAGTYAQQIFQRLLIDLSYNSSRLEGNTYSLLDTERLLLHGDSVEGKLDQEKVMILNHKEAIRFLVDNASKLEVSRNVICTLHFLLADGLIEPKYSGKVRDYAVRIGGSTYVPFEDFKRLQLQLEKIAQKASLISDPFEQSLFLLIHISYLQAFIDVNKRTARLAANIPLITKNLVPLAFRDLEIKDYMSAMIAIYELQDIRPIIDLYIYSYLRTCAAYDSTVKALGFDEVRVRYRQQRRAILRQIILREMTGVLAQAYIEKEAKQVIPKEDQYAFVEDAREDLAQIDHSRIAGLGITSEQLDNWLVLLKKNKGV